MEKFSKGQRYSNEELKQMIRTMTYPQDAPPFVIKTIRAMRRKIERGVKSPEKEIDAAMIELGGSKKYDK